MHWIVTDGEAGNNIMLIKQSEHVRKHLLCVPGAVAVQHNTWIQNNFLCIVKHAYLFHLLLCPKTICIDIVL